MMEFISQYCPFIIAGVLLLALVIYLAVTKQWANLKKLAYALMLSAERLYEENQGQEKFNAVFEKFYELIPKWIKIFITPEFIKTKLQELYTYMKDALSDDTASKLLNE